MRIYLSSGGRESWFCSSSVPFCSFWVYHCLHRYNMARGFLKLLSNIFDHSFFNCISHQTLITVFVGFFFTKIWIFKFRIWYLFTSFSSLCQWIDIGCFFVFFSGWYLCFDFNWWICGRIRHDGEWGFHVYCHWLGVWSAPVLYRHQAYDWSLGGILVESHVESVLSYHHHSE